jgi:hypothetical protein
MEMGHVLDLDIPCDRCFWCLDRDRDQLNSKNIEQTIEQLRYGVNTSLAFTFSAVVAALLAKGKGRSLTAASALIPTFIPLAGLHRSVYVDGFLDQDFKFSSFSLPWAAQLTRSGSRTTLTPLPLRRVRSICATHTRNSVAS